LLSLSLSKLDISDCNLFAEGGKALAAGLKGNQAITELNVSNNFLGMDSDHDGDISGIIAIADVIGDGAMTDFDISSNDIRAEGGKALAEGLKGNQVIKELNFSRNIMVYNFHGQSDTSGIIAIADVIPGMGAMTSLHVGMNNIPEKEMKEIMTIAASMESMKMLCKVPFKDKTITKLDISGKSLGMEGALVVAEYLRDNGALSILSLKKNDLYAEGGTALAAATKGSLSLTSAATG
jgi:Ran GTPase-activating protein (RanGAP) involved in mRNA processing and transport